MNTSIAIQSLIDVARRQHKSLATERTYAGWLKQYCGYMPRINPLLPSEKKVESFLTHLAKDRDVSASTQNQAFCAIDKLEVFPHTMRYEIRINKQAIWQMDGSSERRNRSIGQNSLDMPMRLRIGKKCDDSKPCEWNIRWMRKGCLRISPKTRCEEYSRISRLGCYEAALPESKEQRLSLLGWAWNKSLRRMGGKFSVVPPARWHSAFREAHLGSNKKRRELRTGKCSMGNSTDSTKQQAEQSERKISRANTICVTMVCPAWRQPKSCIAKDQSRMARGTSTDHIAKKFETFLEFQTA